MVEIEYMPYQKLVVHEVRKMEIAEFLSFVVSQAEAQKQGAIASANWHDGIGFVTAEFLPSPQTVEENLKGRIHYAAVLFAETSYQQDKKVLLGGREFVVRFNKTESNPILVELARFLKNFKP